MKKVLILLTVMALLVGMLATASAEGEFKVGIILPLTGNYAEFGLGQRTAYTMALDDLNAAGGVNGKTVVATFEDSGSDPTVSAELIKKFIEDPECMMVFGDYDSGTSLAMAPIAQENGMPMLCCSASNAGIPLTGDYVFSMVGVQQDEQMIVVQEIMHKYLEGTKGAIVYLDNSWGQTIYETQQMAYEGDDGIELVEAIPVSSGETDYASVVTKLRMSGADVVFLALQVTEISACINYMASVGYNEEAKIVLSGAAYTDQLIDLTGENSEGMIITQPFFIDENNPTVVDWCAKYTEDCGLSPNMMTVCAYDGLKMSCEAINAAGAEDRAAVRDAVAKIADYEGITGNITFDDIGTVHRLQNIVGIVDGEWTLLEDTSFCADHVPYDFGGYPQ